MRRLNIRTRQVTTVAGTQMTGFGSGGFQDSASPLAAQFNGPVDIAVGADGLYVADFYNYRIRKVRLDTGATSTLAGTSAYGNKDGAGASALIGYQLWKVFAQPEYGRLLFADGSTSRIRSMAITALPQPPSDLRAVAMAGLKIRLDWQKSPSSGVTQYRIYQATVAAAFDFSSPLGSVSAQTTSYLVASGLEDGKLYRYVVRASSGTLEERNTAEASARAFDALDCPVAFLKNPDNNKKVSGGMLTVMADFAEEVSAFDLSRVQQVLFEYRASSETAFAAVPAANANHPNPDYAGPYFVHWDVSDLANGEFHLRARADCGSGYPAEGSYISIQVEHVMPEMTESVSGTEQVLSDTVGNQKANEVFVADPVANQMAQVSIPGGALSNSTDTVSVRFKKGECGEGQPVSDPIVFSRLEVTLGSGQSNLNQPVTLTFDYDDALLAAAGIVADKLKAGYLDAGRWTELASTVDTDKKRVTTQTTHFSVFGLFAQPAAARDGIYLDEVYFYPNPAVRVNPTLHAETNAPELLLRIYNKAGERVHESTIADPLVLVSDGAGLQSAHERVWDVSGLAPDVYFYYVEARNGGATGIKRTGKVAVIK